MIANVLIVDDDAANLAYLRTALSRHADRFRVITAGDGIEALEVLRRESVALVVTDLKMPRLDGFGLLLRIAQDHPQVPRMVMTSFNSPVTQYQVEKNDILEYFVKPVLADALVRRILPVVEAHAESGFLKGISISSFVQLVDIEQKSCTITVQDNRHGRTGTLYFRDGQLLDARLGPGSGLDAACTILSWPDTRISIKDACPEMPDSIRRKVQDVLMLAAQKTDEGAATEEAAGAPVVAPSPAPSAPPPSTPPAAVADDLRKLDDVDLQDRAFDAFRAGQLEEARRCFMTLLGRDPANKIAAYNLRVIDTKLGKQKP